MAAANPIERVAVVGAGRMGRGLALAFAYAGAPVQLIDAKSRSAGERRELGRQVRAELDRDLAFLADLGAIEREMLPAIQDRIEFSGQAQAGVGAAQLVLEAVPEVLEIKRAALGWIADTVPPDAVIASTTSTFLVDELARLVSRPQRFVNAHWLNPAHLMPLVEISRGRASDDATVAALTAVLRRIGKVPVVCSASPGYIVPRIQALAMNEAARLVEEGVASAEDVDTAVRVGFGLRFAVLGLLEFIDWGGDDILYYASNYLAKTIDPARFKPPAVVVDHMHRHRRGIRDGVGFYDYSAIDTDAYRADRLTEFVRLLDGLGLMPKPHCWQ